PTRVGRIAVLEGNVSFHASPQDPWTDAAVNYPVAQAGQLWVEPGGRAEIGLGEARIRLDGGSELDIVQFDDQNVILSVPQGRVDVFLHGRHTEERYLVETPRGNVEIGEDGHYRIFAGSTGEPTRVAAFRGLAVIAEPQTQVSINRGEEAVISPNDPPSFSVSPAAQDPFDHWGEERERRVTESVSSRYVSADMPGAADLDQYGTWRDDAQYGHVWIPSGVEAGWAPYHNGHWASVQPWGWTWVDDAPWGFAPFHYGRWASIGGGWGWIPGEVTVHPVYAPALVAWVGDPGALVGGRIGVGIGGVGVSVGWIPLGPREIWVPPYHTSIDYVRAGNVAYVSHDVVNNITVNNITVVHNNTTFVNQQHVTVVPQQAFANAQSVQHTAVAVTPAALSRPIVAASTPAKILPAPAPAAALATAHPVSAPPAAKLAIAHPITPTNNLPKLAPASAAPAAHPAPGTPATPPAMAPPGAPAEHPAPGTPATPPAMAHPGAPAEHPAPGTPATPPAMAHPGTPAEHPAPGTPATPPAMAHPGAPAPAPAEHSAAPTPRPGAPEIAHPAAPAASPTAPAIPHPNGPAAPPSHAPLPAPAEHPAPMAPRPGTPDVAHPTAPMAPQMHAPAPPAPPSPQVHAPAPPAPQTHAPAPPPPAVHAPPAPAPQVHAPAPPPPAAHAPPAPAPQVHAPAPPPPAAHAPAPAAQPAHPAAQPPKKDDKDKKDQPH
ncbi:MAG: hypothetical protein QOJ54_2870, partial [Aliidongia sp.]|nr:hypothetical protein [Aliidongia sp.]